jgi:signal transduction histidine kinase
MGSETAASPEQGWGDWRANLFRRESRLLVLVLAPVLVAAALMRRPGALFLWVTLLCFLVVSALVAIASRDPRRVRVLAAVQVGALVAVAMAGVVRYGLVPGALLALVAAVIVVATFLGTRAMWTALAVNTVLLVAVGALASARLVRPAEPLAYFDWSRIDLWLRFAAAYFATTAVVSSTLATVIRHLERNLRERERLLASEREARGAAEEAIGIREEFLSIAAHELRTPCTSLGLSLQGLSRRLKERGADEDPVIRRLLEGALRQAGQLNALNEQLLEVSSLSSGRIALVLSEVDLAGVVRAAVGRAGPRLHASGSALRIDPCESTVGRWDRSRLEQATFHLVSNAIKYGAGKPIEIGVWAEGNVARLVVRDHGIGIATEDLTRIFGRFERAVSARHYGGFGLGLYVVQQTVERLGGRVECTSMLGEGSTFTVLLPREGPAEGSRAAKAMPSPDPGVRSSA